MNYYLINEGAIPLHIPGDWADQSINILELRGALLSLVITRETVPKGKAMQEHLQQQVQRLEQQLPEFEVLNRAPVSFSDQRSEFIFSRWRPTEQEQMDQLTCCVPVDAHNLLIFTATHPTPFPDNLREDLIQTISGFRTHSSLAASPNGEI